MVGRLARSFGPLFSKVALGVLAVGAIAAGTPGCAAEPDDDSSVGEDDYTRKKGKLQLVVTVDWEGRDLREDNLLAMQNLHTRFPQVKIVHFLNAGYYTKQGANRADVTARVNRAIQPGDEKALHIHGWKRLFEASGLTFRASPTFWGTSLNANGNECISDCGHEVPISNYTSDELRKVVKFSLDTLETNGFGRAKSFRCGGWMAKPNVRDAIAAEGLTYEHSAVPVSFLKEKLGTTPVYGWLSELWQGMTNVSQPYTITTASTPLIEVPDNGALADYANADQMVETFHANKAAFLRDRKKNVVVSVGFHEETAASYLPQLESALQRMYDEAKAENIPFESVTSEALTVPVAPVTPPSP
ncbi:MAG: hypothetical protein H0U00_14855 [Actinobacteria bacterium]|nr:hypothetical protein [Actinomycetota bacterium]